MEMTLISGIVALAAVAWRLKLRPDDSTSSVAWATLFSFLVYALVLGGALWLVNRGQPSTGRVPRSLVVLTIAGILAAVHVPMRLVPGLAQRRGSLVRV